MAEPEFARPERVDTIGTRPRSVTIEADASERAALAKRFGLIAIDALTATFEVVREGEAVLATGRVAAAVTQACSVTGEPLPARVDEAVALRFLPEGAVAEDELELAKDALDTLSYAGGAIDLGEAAAETMALALDPFPRGPNAAAALKAAGVKGEDEVGAFSGLAALREKLGKA